MTNAERELQDEYGAQFGDPRRCPSHPHVVTSSPDGMFDAPCGVCEAAMDRDDLPTEAEGAAQAHAGDPRGCGC